MMRDPPKIWLMKLVLPGPMGIPATGILIFSLLTVLFYMTGIFGAVGTPKGVILFFSAVIAFVCAVSGWIAAKAAVCRDDLLPLLPDDDAAAIQFDRRSLRWQFTWIGVGFGLWLGHTMLLFLAGDLQLTGREGFFSAVVAAGSLGAWVSVTCLVNLLIEYAIIFRRLAQRVSVDIFQTELLAPFSQMAVAFMFTMVGVQAALPLMLIGGFSIVAFLPGWLVIFVPMLVLMAVTVLPVRQRLVEVKRQELRRVNSEIQKVRRACSAIVDEATGLAPLLVYRREVQALREWPFDIGVIPRIILYLLIPPVTWIGAALIENLVGALL